MTGFLIPGETGTGKALSAIVVHHFSKIHRWELIEGVAE